MNGGIELVFIPAPVMGHLISAIEMAKLLLQKRGRDDLSISVLIMKPTMDAKLSSYVESLLAAHEEPSSSRLKFVLLTASKATDNTKNTTFFHSFTSFIGSHQQSASKIVSEIQTRTGSGGTRLAGIVVDMFCVGMMDLADEFGIPAYVYYTSGAAMLGLHLHLRRLKDDYGKDVTEFKESDPDLEIPTYSKPFPVKLLPAVTLDKTDGVADLFSDIAKRIRGAKGILVNTFLELEVHALEFLRQEGRVPPVYPVGPALNLQGKKNGESGEEILEWLNGQPDSSVVFLCFGSEGSFPDPQLKEIAHALERGGQRFLWALRKPPPQRAIYPTNLNYPEDILPEGFLERMKDVGKVVGWAPQAAVLAHPAVGGFVSHCGWNSTLESVWFGVPMATWPIYAEQQANAFQLVTDIGIGVDLKSDYRIPKSSEKVLKTVEAEVIEASIRKLMDHPSVARKKAEELRDKSREAVEEGGSSFNSLQAFFHELSL
ncbi:unnamed protein product [Cuscuta epithymum]|uniref:Glycosyltransferase n=1 Tax=Cuscuta epithymum TaxID=186058 RepID=A0AAV0ECC8_9ASTE|nr:unnamed protein product [Cuscuta epithymum]